MSSKYSVTVIIACVPTYLPIDKYNNLNYKHDNYNDVLLEESVDQEEPVEVADLL